MWHAAKKWVKANCLWLWAGIYRRALTTNHSPLPAGLDVHIARHDELRAIAQDPQWQMTPEFVDAALERGDVCVVTYLNNELASYGWVGYAKTPHVRGVFIDFNHGHRYNYKAFTAPRFRGRHLRGSYGVLGPTDRQRGASHSLAFIDYKNTSSRKAEMRNGGRQIGYSGFIKLGDLFMTISTPGAKRYGFRFVRGVGTH